MTPTEKTPVVDEMATLNKPTEGSRDIIDSLYPESYEAIIEALFNLLSELRGDTNRCVSTETNEVNSILLTLRNHIGADFDVFLGEMALYFHDDILYILDSDYQRTAICILEITNYMSQQLEKENTKPIEIISHATAVYRGRIKKVSPDFVSRNTARTEDFMLAETIENQFVRDVNRYTNSAEDVQTLTGRLNDFHLNLCGRYDDVKDGGVIDEGEVRYTKSIDGHYLLGVEFSNTGLNLSPFNFRHTSGDQFTEDDFIRATLKLIVNRKVLLIKRGDQGYLRLPSIH